MVISVLQTGHSIIHSDDVHYQATLLTAWGQGYSQLKSGGFSGSVATFRNGPLKLFAERMNRAVYQCGALPEGRLAFGLPAAGGAQSCICGEEGSADSLLVFSGRSGFEFLSPENFEFLGIEIDTTETNDPMFQSLALTLARIISAGDRAITLDSRRARKLGRLLRLAMTGERLAEWPDHGRAFGRGLLGWILDLLDSAETEGEDRAVRHWDAVAKIRQLVVEGHNCPHSVAELTVELGMSRRTLQNACQEVLGISPVQYLRALRLSEARRQLENAASVTEAATQFGFWHLGYFARDYNAMFGELPSKTLARARGGAS